MYELLGFCLAAAALLTLNAGATAAAALLWRGVARRAQAWPAARRARVLFALRVCPAVGALLFVAAIWIPAYVYYEPRHAGERVSLTLAAAALVSLAGLMLAGRRGAASWLATRRLTTAWLKCAAPLELAGWPTAAYRLRHVFPVVAIVGIWRPRLFVAEQLLRTLTADELAAVAAHERGHLTARDNLKRVWLRVCRDLLTIVPCGRALDRAYSSAAEAAADEYAARDGAAAALDLAAALVKIAGAAPPGATATMPAGVFLLGDNLDGPDGLDVRVRRLTELAESAGHSAGHSAGLARSPFMPAAGSALLLATVWWVADARLLAAVHAVIEGVVAALK